MLFEEAYVYRCREYTYDGIWLRLPTYHRLDFRVSRNFNVGSGVLQAYFDVFNVYNRANLRGYFFFPRVNDGAVTVIQSNGKELLPILPTIAFRWEF